MNKEATTDYEIMDLLKKRWSPRAFSDKIVEKETLGKLFEAAHWSASCYNEQPWRFIVATKENQENYQKVFNCLVEGNQIWAKSAPVLVIIIGKKTFTHNSQKNDWYQYDAGQSAAHLSVEAMKENLYVHQMAGINKSLIKDEFKIPDDFEPLAGMAIGYLGDPNILPEGLKEKELEVRIRKSLKSLVFTGNWEENYF